MTVEEENEKLRAQLDEQNARARRLGLVPAKEIEKPLYLLCRCGKVSVGIRHEEYGPGTLCLPPPGYLPVAEKWSEFIRDHTREGPQPADAEYHFIVVVREV